jgi:hypothetical protein
MATDGFGDAPVTGLDKRQQGEVYGVAACFIRRGKHNQGGSKAMERRASSPRRRQWWQAAVRWRASPVAGCEGEEVR